MRALAALVLLLILIAQQSGAQEEHPWSVGGSLQLCSFYYFAPEDSVPLLGSPFSCGGLFTSCSVWLTRYWDQLSFGRVELGFWTSAVPGSDPPWLFMDYYTGEQRGALMISAVVKNYNLLPFGLGIGYGIGISADWLDVDTWVNGVSSRESARSVDLVFPLELIYLPNRRCQVSIDYIPSFARCIDRRIVFSSSHVFSLGIGCNLNFGRLRPAR